ncbi:MULTISPECIES: SOS response-associated peptidase [unclassified Haladaptatus]|uniref:SOS response-associated peptidase n=1 Tax=unclassified Haladaptatus TaxID=2622732 RepID=UPI0023E8A2CE|nr:MULTISPECIES: SOS response-associated peptidase [unclassified Haladaptatus]
MCGRYSLFTPPEEVEERFDARFERSFRPRYNAAPSQNLPVIQNTSRDTIRTLRWGLIPSWADDAKVGNKRINARAETVREKRSFAEAYEQRRCLVLADGFYEWAKTDSGKQPYRVSFEDDRPFAMAGLWERWTPPQKQTGLGDFGGGDKPDARVEPIESFTIITTEPNDLIEPLHNRMAVILEPEAEDAWLTGDPEEVYDLLRPYPDDSDLRAYPVSTVVNNPSNDRPEIVEEVDLAA